MDAQTAFDQSLAESKRLLQQLQEQIDNHLGTGPDVHWGHVGDANQIKGQLEQIVKHNKPLMEGK